MHEDESSSDAQTDRSSAAERARERPPVDALLDALADRRRRRVLRYLAVTDDATAEELAAVLVGWRLEPGLVLGQNERERVHRSLRHVHLPKLDQAGLVAYDRDADSVSLASLPEAAWDVVTAVTEYEPGADAVAAVDDHDAR